MIVLGLDQAPRGAGFCYGDGSTAPRWGYREFPDYAGNESALMDHVFDWVVTLGKSIGAEAIYTEQIVINWKRQDSKGRDRSAFDTNTLHKQFAVYDAVAFAAGKRGLNIDHYEAGINEWRKWFLGLASGNSETLKDLAMRECARRNLLPKSHHEAEAIGIWSFGLSKLDRAYLHRERVTQRRAELERTKAAA